MGRNLSVLGVVFLMLPHCAGAETPRAPRETPAPRVPASPARVVRGAAAVVPPPPAPQTEDPADFGARMPAREISRPTPPRGRSAAFTFDGARRGWVASLAEGNLLTSAAYADGKVFIGGGFTSTSFYALDGETGHFKWHASAPDGGPTAAIVTGGKVLFNTESCTLFCVDAETGRRKWSLWLGDPLMSQPAAAGDLVYAAHIVDGMSPGGEAGGYRLTALRIENGRQVWTRVIDSDVLSAPVVQDGSVYATTMGGRVYRFDAVSGRRVWTRPVGATAAPWVEGDLVYLSRRRPRGKEQQVVLSTETGEVVAEGSELPARYAAARPDSGGVQAGWGWEGSRPVLAAGRAYYAMGDELRAKDLRTGEEVWRRRYTGGTNQRGITPPAVVGGNLVVGTRAGHLYGVDIDTGLTTFAYDIGEPIAFQPIVAKGWVYATTTRGRVIGLEVADPGFDGWHMWGGNASHTGVIPASFGSTGSRRPEDARPSEGTLRVEIEGERRELPLRHTKVDAHVSGFVARVTVEQTFHNSHDRALEAVYLFPLPTDAAVDSMEMRIGDRVIEGSIQRKQEARRIYLSAKQRGVLTSLLEQERPNLFRQRVANIPPAETVQVTLRYAEMLPYEDGRYELVFPLVAAPRYTPGVAPVPTAPAGSRSSREVDLAVHLDAGVHIEALRSPSHSVEVDRDGDSRARVSLAARDRIPDKDFVLRWRVAGDAPRAAVLASTQNDEGFFTLMIHPRARPPTGEIMPREVVFLVDASSSMSGRSIVLARNVVGEALAGLGEADAFRILRFSDSVAALDEAALPATRENVARARAFLAGLAAGGATEMTSAVDAAFSQLDDAGRMKIVVLVSDGNVGNEDEVLRAVASKLGTARLFAVGVGAAPNRYLLERAAEAGRGAVQFVGLADDAAEVARTFASRIDRPYLTDIAIDWGGLPIRDVYPRIVPDLYADHPVLVHGRYDGGGQGMVRLTGRIGGRAWSAEVPAALPASANDHEALPSVWARARVKDLMTAMILRESDELREEVAQTGLRFGLVTAYTSFVAVDEETRVDRTHGEARTEQGVEQPAMGALMGRAVGEAYGFGGLGLSGTGYGGGGTGEGTIGLGSVGTIGRGAGGGSGFGYGSGMAGMSAGSNDSASPSYPMALSRPDTDGASGSMAPVDAHVPPAPIMSAPTEARGALGAETVRRTVRSRTNEVRACYEAALRRNPNLAGRVSVRFTIGADGRVTGSEVSESTLGDAEAERCIAEAVRSWTFPRPANGGVITVTYPFVLQPGRAD